jgi:hypothetical protein
VHSLAAHAHADAYTHPVVVNDLGNDRELAGRGAVVDENDAADLDEALEGGGRGLGIRTCGWKSLCQDVCAGQSGLTGQGR